MNTIKKLFSSKKQFQYAELIKIFKSKKNTVSLIHLHGQKYVLKMYSLGMKKNMVNEYCNLKSLDSVNTPTVFEADFQNRYLLMNYIQGENVCGLINDETVSIQEKSRMINLLAKWFYKLHQNEKINSRCLIHGDATLRNFIFHKTIFGLDFEESHINNPIHDISNLCASILTTEPKFTNEKQQLHYQFVETYKRYTHDELFGIDNAIKTAIKETQQRRKRLFR